MSRQTSHRVEKRLSSVVTNVLQQFVNLRTQQEQTVPKLPNRGSGQASARNLPLDFGSRLKWRFLISLWEFQSATWKEVVELPHMHTPVPARPEAGHLLSQSHRTERTAPIMFPCP